MASRRRCFRLGTVLPACIGMVFGVFVLDSEAAWEVGAGFSQRTVNVQIEDQSYSETSVLPLISVGYRFPVPVFSGKRGKLDIGVTGFLLGGSLYADGSYAVTDWMAITGRTHQGFAFAFSEISCIREERLGVEVSAGNLQVEVSGGVMEESTWQCVGNWTPAPAKLKMALQVNPKVDLVLAASKRNGMAYLRWRL